MNHLKKATRLLAAEYDPEYAKPPQYVSQGSPVTVNMSNLLFSQYNPVNDDILQEITELIQENYELPPVAVTTLSIEDSEEAESFSENYYLYEDYEKLEPGEYWVIEDGHHRALAQFTLGFDEIDAVEV